MCACPADAEEAIPAIFQGCKIRTDIGVMAIVVGDPGNLVRGSTDDRKQAGLLCAAQIA
jgi:hypothetical protein